MMQDLELGRLFVMDTSGLGPKHDHTCCISFARGPHIPFASVIIGARPDEVEKMRILRTMTVAPQAVQLLRDIFETGDSHSAEIEVLLKHVDREIKTSPEGVLVA